MSVEEIMKLLPAQESTPLDMEAYAKAIEQYVIKAREEAYGDGYKDCVSDYGLLKAQLKKGVANG